MSDMDCEMQGPSPEHNELLKGVGTWNITSKFYMAPGAPPMDGTATEVVTSMGPFWIMGEFKADFMGMPYEGRSTVGFDPWSGEYVSTWHDSMSPNFFYLRGKKEEDTIVLRGEARAPQGGTMANYKINDRVISDDERHMEMFMEVNGEEVKLFEMHYLRA
jgi:uncharacterized protein DUF1579